MGTTSINYFLSAIYFHLKKENSLESIFNNGTHGAQSTKRRARENVQFSIISCPYPRAKYHKIGYK